jgi:DNA-binding NarL/FixJ family response regulator
VLAVLTDGAGCDVVEADDTAQLVSALQAHRPDLVLIDSELPAASELRRMLPTIHDTGSHVILWGFTAGPELAIAAFQAGADGVLHKDISAQGLVRTVDAALRGEVVCSRGLIRSVFDHMRLEEERHRARESILALSLREQEVLELLASGAGTRTVAEALHISEFTVKRHVQNILHRLDLRSRGDAAQLYRSAVRYDTAPLGTPPARAPLRPVADMVCASLTDEDR